jgi:hypothetical protein
MKVITAIFQLSTWGKVAAFAEVYENPYFGSEGPEDPEEPRYIIDGIEVYRGEEGNIYKGLNRSELAEVEERLVEVFELVQAANEAERTDSRIDSHRLEYA